METLFEIELPPVVSYIIDALQLAAPLVALGSWFAAIRAAWRHERGVMAVLIGVAILASAVTAYSLLAT
jgi:hypothetical protein